MAKEEKFPKGVTRRQLLKYGLYGGLAMGAGASIWRYARRSGYHGRARHVIFISLDTTRADHLGCYANKWIKTPNLDALADESILFTDYMTAASTTLASHTSLLTGKYPQNHGVPRNGFMVNPDNVMLPEILKDAGFHTVGFLGSFALDQRFDFAQGFDHFDQEFDMLVGTRGNDQNQRSAKTVTDAVISYLDQQPLPSNLFLFAHYFDPHAPYAPPGPYDRMYGYGSGTAATQVEDPAAQRAWKNSARTKRLGLLYAGEVSYMDTHVGRLLDYLKNKGILDSAILVVTSDHGENLVDARSRLFHHGWTVYQSEVDAVCMVRLPAGAQGGTKYTSLIGSVDILPTLTSYLSLPIPAGIDGQPLDLLNLRAPTEPRIRFAEATKPWDVETDPRWYNVLKSRCARRGSFKYIHTAYRKTEELYDLSTDPYERNNLLTAAATEPIAKIADDLRKSYQAWTASAKPLPTRYDPSQREETIRRLKSLGYF